MGAETFRAGSHKNLGIVVLALLEFLPVERPLALVGGESVALAVSNVVEDDRGFPRNESQHPPDLLEVENERLGGPEQLRRHTHRHVEPLADQFAGGDDLILPGGESLNPVVAVFV